jgi:hypothetical protein
MLDFTKEIIQFNSDASHQYQKMSLRIQLLEYSLLLLNGLHNHIQIYVIFHFHQPLQVVAKTKDDFVLTYEIIKKLVIIIETLKNLEYTTIMGTFDLKLLKNPEKFIYLKLIIYNF